MGSPTLINIFCFKEHTWEDKVSAGSSFSWKCIFVGIAFRMTGAATPCCLSSSQVICSSQLKNDTVMTSFSISPSSSLLPTLFAPPHSLPHCISLPPLTHYMDCLVGFLLPSSGCVRGKAAFLISYITLETISCALACSRFISMNFVKKNVVESAVKLGNVNISFILGLSKVS